MAPGRQIITWLALLTAVLALAGCGGSDERELEGEPFSQQEQEDWTNALAAIGDYADEGDCSQAKDKLSDLVAGVNAVPEQRDDGLKSDLLDLLTQLGDQIDEECEPVDETTTSSTTSQPETTVPPETTTPTTTTAPPTTTSTDKTTTTETTTEETTTTTEPPPEEPGDGGGPPVTPPGQGGGSDGGSGGTAPGKVDKKLGSKEAKG